MNCPHCQSTKEPKFSRELPMGYFCPDCAEGVDDSATARVMAAANAVTTSFRTELIRKEDAELAVSNITTILADPHKVMLNMLHGTIAWTPETLRRVLGPDPVRDILKAMVAELDRRPVPDVIEDLIARAKAALTATEPK